TSQLAFELGVASCNSDVVRKQMAGIPAGKQARDAYNQGLYDQQSHEATYAELLRRAEQHLIRGSSVIIDACFTHRDQRSPFAALADRQAVPFVILHVACSDAENKRRLLDRETTGASVSDGRLELLDYQTTGFEPPEESEGTLITLNGTAPPTTLADEIYTRLTSC
ncbi:MAG: ATP-binding protein, partial [Verrucomicrobia bacterium]|nr:ATP-binding protein [Deltaproteobacteria bacterium]